MPARRGHRTASVARSSTLGAGKADSVARSHCAYPSEPGRQRARRQRLAAANWRFPCLAFAMTLTLPRSTCPWHWQNIILLSVSDTGTGMDKHTQTHTLRAVFHHQGKRPRHGPWTRDGLRIRKTNRRLYLGGKRTRPRLHIRNLFADHHRSRPQRSAGCRRNHSRSRFGNDPFGGRRRIAADFDAEYPRRKRLCGT